MVTVGSETPNAINDIYSGKLNLECYPNPFEESLQLTFSVENTTKITIEAFHLTGSKAGEVASQSFNPGVYTITWTYPELAKGAYFIRLTTAEGSTINKMVVKR
ncbi:MAG: T9SS type A sorting domain-containing protein [Bacteroidales bacterium]|nr:T9SS type A sorting domain-containing protein [Bacteroidales bacterium]